VGGKSLSWNKEKVSIFQAEDIPAA